MGNALVNKALAAYAGSNNTLPPLLAVVRLYEKAASNLHAARSLMQEKHFLQANKEIEKAVAIFAGLQSVVNNVDGDDMGDQLRLFYLTMIGQAGRVMSSKDPIAAVERIIELWTSMLEAWRDVATTSQPSTGAGGPAFPPGGTGLAPAFSRSTI